MFTSLLYDEEGMLVLNLKQIQADYVSGKYKMDPYGKVFVSCPSGYYPLFAYLSRIAGMKDAKKALKKFRAEKMAVLERDTFATIQLERENALEDLLRRSFYYYYYADADQIRSTERFLDAFQENVYNSEYDFEEFCAGVEEDIHENSEAWEEEQRAFAHALQRMNNNEHCDSVDAAKEAVKEAAIYLGSTQITEENMDKFIYNQATALYYMNCIGIVAERYASPVYALPEFVAGDPVISVAGRLSKRKTANAYATICKDDVESVRQFMYNEAIEGPFQAANYYTVCNRSAEKSLRHKRTYVRTDEYDSVRQRNSGADYDFSR